MSGYRTEPSDTWMYNSL